MASVRAATAPDPLDALRRHWGYERFLPLQREAIEAALAGRDALVVLPTGGGKSLCYQIPAAVRDGLVLVVSPLIALMDDQVCAAREAGLAADALHSNLEGSDRADAWRRLLRGETRLLYVSPERLLAGDVLDRVADRVTLVAVDEAHCVSHWGHEFRPEYRRLAEAFDRLPHAARMALTATATGPVRADIAAQLPLRDPAILVGHPDRANLVYRAFPRRDPARQVMEIVRRHPGEGGIVYAQARRDTERLANGLAKAGVRAAAYHAGLDADVRRRVQDDFVHERLDVVCATIAFGMGIDRSNVRFVVHANAPRSVEHYQQESGRAGRDGLPAECVILFAASDLARHRALSGRDGPLPADRQRALDRQLREIGRFAVAPVCRHRLLAEHFDAPYPPPGSASREAGAAGGCGACDVCLGETAGLPDGDALMTAKKILSAAWRAQGRYGAGYVADLLLGKQDDRIQRNGHDALEVFGILRDAGEASVRSWIDQLVVQEFLEVTEEDEYPLLRITEAGKTLCRGEGTVRLAAPVAPPLSPPVRRRRAAATGVPADDAAPDAATFERLRALRLLLARRLGIPPYVVFHDSTLSEMAAQRPTTLSAMRAVRGVGETKLARYGEAFLKALSGADPQTAASAP